MANVIEQLQKPTLVIAHNKTLAAQLYGEFKEMFPDNAVEYFVSYYDYYQPEAYVPSSDTYIAVSYTHLDVYKRQLLPYPRAGERRRRARVSVAASAPVRPRGNGCLLYTSRCV